MSRFHPASLIDPSDHPQELLDFLELDPQNSCVTDYIVHTTTDAAAYALKLGSTDKSRSDILLLSDVMHKKHCGFKQFVSNVVRRSQTRTSTILVALLYLRRAKVVMEIPPPQWILHRLFMGALILATKYTLDSCPQNGDWAGTTGIFGPRDVGKMELEMFEVLDMKLSFNEEELKQLRLEILAAYATELAYLAVPKPRTTPTKSKTPRSRSPDSGDLLRRKRAKFIVEEEDESDDESEIDLESEDLYYESRLEDSPVCLSPPPLSSSVCSSSSTTSTVTPPERRPVKLLRSRASASLYTGFNARSHTYSSLFSPTIEVPIVDPGTTVENFTKSSAAGWHLLQWFKSSQWSVAQR